MKDNNNSLLCSYLDLSVTWWQAEGELGHFIKQALLS
jgi:hypothetical protein